MMFLKFLVPVSIGVILASCSVAEQTNSAILDDDTTRRAECRDTLPEVADSRSFHLHIDDVALYGEEVEDFSDSLSLVTAKKAVRLAAQRSGCDGDSLGIRSDQDELGQLVNACNQIIPGLNLSTACYIEAAEGYFIVSDALPEQIVVTYSRWD